MIRKPTLEARIAHLERLLTHKTRRVQEGFASNGATLGNILSNYAGMPPRTSTYRVLRELENTDTIWIIANNNNMTEDEAADFVEQNWEMPCRVRDIANDEVEISCNGITFSLQYV